MNNREASISKAGFLVPALTPHTARLMWDLSRKGPIRQCENVKTVSAWRAIRHQYASRSMNALTIAARAAREHGMVYVLHADDKVSRVMIDWQGKIKVSSAYPA